MTVQKMRGASRAWLDYLAGGAVGALLGVMIGMSVSPVVAPVATGLVAALLGLLGLRSLRASDKPEEDDVRAVFMASDARRVAGFGIVCVVGAIIGLHARTHDWFGQSFEERLVAHQAAWQKLKYDPDKARDLAAWSAAGVPLPWAAGAPPPAQDGGLASADKEGEGPDASNGAAKEDAPKDRGGSAKAAPLTSRKDDGVFFSGDAGTPCGRLRQYGFVSGAAALTRFRGEGGKWKRLANEAEQQSPDDATQLQFLTERLHKLCPQP